MAETYPLSSLTNMMHHVSYNAYVGTKMFEQATWLRMMVDSFEVIDRERAQLNTNGSWMGRTTGSIDRYARVDVYI